MVIKFINSEELFRSGSHMIFCLDTLHEYSDTLNVKLYTIFQPTFSPIKCYQDILFKLLTLRTDSVTKKITVICAVYFYN